MPRLDENSGCRTKARMKPGFTLLEVLVALALLILVVALVLPTVAGFSESVVFKNTCDQVSSAVSVCRSEAQRRGTNMELVTSRGTDGRMSLVGRPAATEATTAENEVKPPGQILMTLPPGYTFDEVGPVGSAP